jgi:hypothetical protein
MKTLTSQVVNYVKERVPFAHIRTHIGTIEIYKYTSKKYGSGQALAIFDPFDPSGIRIYAHSENSAVNASANTKVMVRVWNHLNICPKEFQKSLQSGPIFNSLYTQLYKYYKGGNFFNIPKNRMRVIKYKDDHSDCR